jgi:hypothetical protein
VSKHKSATPTPAADPLAVVAAERAKRAQQTSKTPKAPKPPKEAGPRPLFRRNGAPFTLGLPCLCGCGAATHTPKAAFLSGHDAKLRQRVLKLGEDLPEVVRPFFEAGATVAGLQLVDGAVVDTKNGSVEEAVEAKQNAA